MAKLIDADRLIKIIQNSTCHNPDEFWKRVVIDIINNQQNVFDKEKVIHELEYEKNAAGSRCSNIEAMAYSKAIDIVNTGIIHIERS